MNLPNLPHTQPDTYEECVAEGRRVRELRREVHISLLAEYVRVKFLTDIGRVAAYEKFLGDIELNIALGTLYRWMRGTMAWLKTTESLHEECPAFCYYIEAAHARDWDPKRASELVRRAKSRRGDQAFRQSIYHLSSLADQVVSKNPPAWLDPDYAQDLLDRLPAVESFLRAAASRKRSA